MEFVGRYHDGEIATARDVIVAGYEGATELTITDLASRQELDRWPTAEVFSVPGRDNELRIGATGRPYGARLLVAGFEETRALRKLLPALAEKQRADSGQQLRIIGIAFAALCSVIVAYVFGVPLLAGRLVALVPPKLEAQLGETARQQIATALGADKGFAICDPDPESLANRAIARLAATAMEGSGSPFTPDIQVVRTEVPNAFALPGGHAFYFSALLEKTEDPDEFAGVMAHELGHVVYRHGMETLIATSATGLLVGFVLGDMTGLSVAGGLGAALIDTRFSREAERDADRYAADVARRMGFRPSALANLLDRVAADDSMSEALALFSSHPLTAERRATLDALTDPARPNIPAFTATEWQAIKTMCKGMAPIGASVGAGGVQSSIPHSPPVPTP